MKIYIIQHKGKTWWGNIVGCMREESKIYIGRFFIRKSDAIKFMKSSYDYTEYLEVVSAELENSNQDNRRRA